MAKKRHVNVELHYKNIINKQKKVIQKLSKRASRGEKLEDRFFDVEDREAELLLQEQAEENKLITTSNRCPKCSNDLDTIEGTKVTVFLCSTCNYRGSKRNG